MTHDDLYLWPMRYEVRAPWLQVIDSEVQQHLALPEEDQVELQQVALKLAVPVDPLTTLSIYTQRSPTGPKAHLLTLNAFYLNALWPRAYVLPTVEFLGRSRVLSAICAGPEGVMRHTVVLSGLARRYQHLDMRRKP